jgi:hypothetical protein
MKNSDLPLIKRLLSADYESCDYPELEQSYQILDDLAQEQNFTFDFIRLPTINERRSNTIILDHVCQ